MRRRPLHVFSHLIRDQAPPPHPCEKMCMPALSNGSWRERGRPGKQGRCKRKPTLMWHAGETDSANGHWGHVCSVFIAVACLDVTAHAPACQSPRALGAAAPRSRSIESCESTDPHEQERRCTLKHLSQRDLQSTARTVHGTDVVTQRSQNCDAVASASCSHP